MVNYRVDDLHALVKALKEEGCNVLEIEPYNALLLRWRGHRYLSVREFDRAFADLTRGGQIDSTIYGIWYHLGVVQHLRGDFADAAASFAQAQPIAPGSDSSCRRWGSDGFVEVHNGLCLPDGGVS